MKEQSIDININHLKRFFGSSNSFPRKAGKKDAEAFNEILKYINDLRELAFDKNKAGIKLILSIVLDEVISNNKTGKEAFYEVQERIKEPLLAIYESIDEEAPFIQMDQILSKNQYKDIFEVKEMKYVFNDDKDREEHNEEVLNNCLDKISDSFKGNSSFRELFEKRAVELLTKYNG